MKPVAIRLRSILGQNLPEVSRSNRASMEEALADLVNALWPVGTRAAVRAEFGLSDSDARRVVEGRASKRVLQIILRHPKGEYAVGLYVLARVIGRPIESYLDEEQRFEDERRERLSRLQDRVPRLAALA